MAMRTQGTLIEYETATPGTFAAIGQVISFDGPGGKATIIDTTNLQSTAKEKLPGLPDEGAFDMSVNYASDDAGQQALQAARLAQSPINIRVTFTDTSTAEFTAYCMQVKLTGKADSKVEADVSMEITGAVDFTPFTPGP